MRSDEPTPRDRERPGDTGEARMPDRPAHDRERISREVVGHRYSRTFQAGPFGDGDHCASTVRSAYGRAAVFGQREQRGSTVFSYGWKHVVEPGELAHQEPVDTPTADTCHRAHVGASYYLEGLFFDWHDSECRCRGESRRLPFTIVFPSSLALRPMCEQGRFPIVGPALEE